MFKKITKTVTKMCPSFLKRFVRETASAVKRWRYKAFAIVCPKAVRVFCPCCGLRFKSFVAGPFIKRRDLFNTARYLNITQEVLCPYCDALPRHRILALWCEKHISQLRSSKILYFASEYGMKLWMERNGIRCTTADLTKKDADLNIDIQNTGLPDESYDVIFANHVLEHVDDFRAGLREVRRIMKKDGFFICSFPMDPKVELLDEDPSVKTKEDRYQHYGQKDHKRVFGMNADRLLTEAGFMVERIDGKDYPDEIEPIVGPGDYDINLLFCCRKSE